MQTPMAAPSFGNQMPSSPHNMPDPMQSPRVHTPSPQAAAAAPRTAARREVGRGARDLFGGGGFGQEAQPVADDVATSAPLFSAGVPAAQPQTGQRDENSVLFSLSALTAKAGTQTPVPSQTTATKDDSGLIDLRALSAGAPSPAASSLVPDNAALFPLGMPVAQPGSVHPSPLLGGPDMAPAKNRTPIFIGLGLVVAVAAVVGAFLVMKGGEEKPPPVATEAPAATPAPTPLPTPEPTATSTAEASASASPSASVAKAAPGKPGAGRPLSKVDPGKSGSSGGASPPPAATPPPKKGGCNCPPGDLMCAMKCSTK
jgi:hypothetical protein